MSHWRKHVDAESEHLKFHDIEGKSPIRVTIEAHSDEKVYEPNEKVAGTMLFVGFKGAEKRLGINHTNGWLIEQAVGSPDVEAWIGKEITLRTANCGGEACIRVDAPKGTRIPSRYPKFTYTDKESK